MKFIIATVSLLALAYPALADDSHSREILTACAADVARLCQITLRLEDITKGGSAGATCLGSYIQRHELSQSCADALCGPGMCPHR
jgi:hypothetical protein